MTNPYLIQGPALISFSGGRTSGYVCCSRCRASGSGRSPHREVERCLDRLIATPERSTDNGVFHLRNVKNEYRGDAFCAGKNKRKAFIIYLGDEAGNCRVLVFQNIAIIIFAWSAWLLSEIELSEHGFSRRTAFARLASAVIIKIAHLGVMQKPKEFSQKAILSAAHFGGVVSSIAVIHASQSGSL